jgi:hypothetical protein
VGADDPDVGHSPFQVRTQLAPLRQRKIMDVSTHHGISIRSLPIVRLLNKSI